MPTTLPSPTLLPGPSQAPLYRRLAGHYLDAMRAGSLQPGDRFPSVRRLMRDHAVSLSTALQACRQLEDDGWLEARPRSGFFVRRPRRAGLPPANERLARADAPPLPSADYTGLHSRVSRVLAMGEQAAVRVNLALAVGAPGLYPAQILQRGMTRLLRSQPQLVATMPRRHGHPDLQAALARRALARGLQVAPQEVIVTQGCVEAINVALRAVTQPGDTVVVESPTFFGLLQVLESLGLKALELPTSPTNGLSLDALAYVLAQADQPGATPVRAVLVMPNLHNPLGAVMPDAHKAALVGLCAQHRVALIEDDIYADMVADDRPLKPLKAWDRDGGVIHCASLNKVLAPGVRLGWLLAGRWQARVEMLKYTQSRYTEELWQRVAAEVLDSPAFDRHLHQLRGALNRQRAQMAEAVARHFPDGTRLSPPPGGLLLWVELPAGVDAERLFEQALALGIKIAPGSLFSNAGLFRHCIRLNCGAVHGPEVEAAVQTLGALASAQRAEVAAAAVRQP